MIKKITISFVVAIAIIIMGTLTANAAQNVLMITNDDAISGSEIKNIVEDVSDNEIQKK